jgi:hypothetical protein
MYQPESSPTKEVNMNDKQDEILIAILYWIAVVIGYVVLVAGVLAIPYLILKMLRWI